MAWIEIIDFFFFLIYLEITKKKKKQLKIPKQPVVVISLDKFSKFSGQVVYAENLDRDGCVAMILKSRERGLSIVGDREGIERSPKTPSKEKNGCTGNASKIAYTSKQDMNL